MNYQRTGFTPVPMHQDGATVSAFQFNRRIEHLQCWRRRGRRFRKRRWNDLESLFSNSGHVVLPIVVLPNRDLTRVPLVNFNSACAHASIY
jgi:hypothetical protein